jgi:hypothetical protein
VPPDPTTTLFAARCPDTARTLLDALAACGPAAEGEELILVSAPAAELEPLLHVLHTGVRALLTGRRWYGCDGSTGRSYELNPCAPIPAGVLLLSVEGDGRWDRIHPSARIDLPSLFEAARPGPRRR